MSSQPVFIIGAPRSGNTLTRRVLMASGSIYIPPETYVVGEIVEAWPRWRRLSWRERAWLFTSYFERHPHFADFEIESLSPLASELEALQPPAQSLRACFDRFYAFMARAHGFTAARWGDKTPWNTVHLPAIMKAFPDAQFLYLSRNGLDAVASQIKADMRDLDGSARRWVEANTACRKALRKAPDRVMQVSYEALVREPEAVFSQVFDWAGLAFETDFLTRVPERLGDVGRLGHHAAVNRPITPASIGRWRETLKTCDIAQLDKSFWDMMSCLGYNENASKALAEGRGCA
jgi:protein-tyrosine sulfotransferase